MDSIPGLEGVVPAAQLALLQKGRLADILQPLMDLGYLHLGHNISIETDPLIQRAVYKWRKEMKDLTLIPLSTIKAPSHSTAFMPITEEELAFLQLLTTLEGQIDIQGIPPMNKTNVYSRIIHYRLRLFGLYKLPVNRAFSERSLRALGEFGSFIGTKDLPLQLHLSGNVDALLKFIANTPKIKKKLVLFFKINQRTNKAILSEIPEGEGLSQVSTRSIPEDIETSLRKLENEFPDLTETESMRQGPVPVYSGRQARIQKKIARLRQKINPLIQEMQIQLSEELLEKEALDKGIKKQEALLEKMNLDLKELEAIKILLLAEAKTKKTTERALEKTKKEQAKIKETILLQFRTISLEILRTELQKFQKKIKFIESEITSKKVRLDQLRNRGKKALKKEIQELNSQKKKLADLIKKLKKAIQQKDRLAVLITQEKEQQKTILSLAKTSQKQADNQTKIKTLKTETSKVQKGLTTSISRRKQLNGDNNRSLSGQQEKIQEQAKKLKKAKQKLDELTAKSQAPKGSFIRKMHKHLEANLVEELNERLFGNRLDTSYILEQINSTKNIFFLKVIQLQMWTSGFYTGRIDGKIGPRSFDALAQFEKEFSNFQIHRLMTQVHSTDGGYIILNFPFLLECWKVDHTVLQEGERSVTEQLFEKYADDFAEDPERTNRVWEELKSLGDLSRGRRIYYGVKKTAKALWNVIQKIWAFLKRGWKKMIDLLKGFVQLLYREMREGVRKYADGMYFLFSKRVFASNDQAGKAIVSTKFDLDFDVIQVMGKQKNSGLFIKKHESLLNRFVDGLETAMILTGKVIHWVIKTASSLNWTSILIKIALEFRKIITKWIRQKVKNIRLNKLATIEALS